MQRLLAAVIVALVVSGCRSSAPPATDPFFPRTTVPPPGTGSIGGQADPYYPAAPTVVLPPASVPSTSPSPGATAIPATPGAQPYAPPYAPPAGALSPSGNFTYPGARATTPIPPGQPQPTPRMPPAAPSGRSAATTPVAPPPTIVLAGRERVVRILEPRASEVTVSAAKTSTRSGNSSVADWQSPPSTAPKTAVDIMDLPKAGAARSSR